MSERVVSYVNVGWVARMAQCTEQTVRNYIIDGTIVSTRRRKPCPECAGGEGARSCRRCAGEGQIEVGPYRISFDSAVDFIERSGGRVPTLAGRPK